MALKTAAIQDLRGKPALVFDSGEPVLVTKRGKVSGVYVPLDKIHRPPDDIRRNLAGAVGKHIAKSLHRKGITSLQVKEGFRAYRRRRR
jgi:hypothetical protein